MKMAEEIILFMERMEKLVGTQNHFLIMQVSSLDEKVLIVECITQRLLSL